MSTPPANSGPSVETQPARRDERSLQLILDQEPTLFVNIVGEPFIGLPIPKSTDRTPWILNHQRVRAEITGFIWENLDLVIHAHELNRILRVLECHAWRDQRVNIQLKDAIDNDPLLEGLVIFLIDANRRGGVNLPASELLTELSKVARKSGVDTNHHSWPKGAAQLSRRIGELSPILQQAGINVKRGRNPGGVRFINIHREPCDDGKSTASQPPPIDKSHRPKTLPAADSGDDESEAVFSAISLKRERNEG